MSRLDSRLLRALDDWLFPERVACLCCDAALGGDDQSGLCSGCAQALSRLAGEIEALPPPTGIDEALAAFPYADHAPPPAAEGLQSGAASGRASRRNLGHARPSRALPPG